MHICFVSLDYPTENSGGGVASVTKILAECLTRQGIRVSVIMLGSSEEHFLDGNIHVFKVNQGPLHYYVNKLPWIGKMLALPIRELERSYRIRKKLEAIHRDNPLDIIEFTEEAGFFMLFSKLRNKTKYLARLHGTEYSWTKKMPGKKMGLGLRLQRILQRFFLKKCDYLISPSQFYKTQIIEEFGREFESKIKVQWNPCSIDKSGLIEKKKEDTHPPSIPSILYCARIQDVKGIDLLIKAAGSLVTTNPDVVFKVAGNFHPSIPEARFFQLIAEHKLETHFKILGHLNHTTLLEEMIKSTAVVVPSYWESFGLVGIEAIFADTKIIHTRVGFFHDLDRALSGVKVIQANSEVQLSEALREILTEKGSVDLPQRKKDKQALQKLLSPKVHADFIRSLAKQNGHA